MSVVRIALRLALLQNTMQKHITEDGQTFEKPSFFALELATRLPDGFKPLLVPPVGEMPIHTCIHTHTYIHTFIHSYIHTTDGRSYEHLDIDLLQPAVRRRS